MFQSTSLTYSGPPWVLVMDCTPVWCDDGRPGWEYHTQEHHDQARRCDTGSPDEETLSYLGAGDKKKWLPCYLLKSCNTTTNLYTTYFYLNSSDSEETEVFTVIVRPVLFTLKLLVLSVVSYHDDGVCTFLPYQPPVINQCLSEWTWREWASNTHVAATR